MDIDERENLVIQLHKEGKTIREIAKEVHMSFRDIGKITKKINKGSNTNTVYSDALKLFLDGKTPLEVATTLKISAKKALNIYRDYLKLQGKHKLVLMYDTLGDDIFAFFELFKILKENNLTHKQVVIAVKYAQYLPFIKNRIAQLRNEINKLESRRNQLYYDLLRLQQNYI